MTTKLDIIAQNAYARSEGKAEGKAEATMDIAKRMLAAGMDPSLITQVTGLPLEQVKALIEE